MTVPTEAPPEAITPHALRRIVIDETLPHLTFREREILKLRKGWGDGYIYTLAEVAKIFKVTRERVRQIEKKAKKRFRRAVAIGVR